MLQNNQESHLEMGVQIKATNFHLFRSFNGFGKSSKSILMHEHQFSPFELYDDQGFDGFLRGLTTQPAQKFDPKFSKEVIKFLPP